MRSPFGLWVLCLAITLSVRAEINVLTDLGTPFPPGCVSLNLPEQPASNDNTLFDLELPAPSVGGNGSDAVVRATIWRVGCHDPGFSVVLVRLRLISAPTDTIVMVPRLFAEAGEVDFPLHIAQLIPLPAIGPVGASSEAITAEGATWMVAVEPLNLFNDDVFLPNDYNGSFTLEFFWGDFSVQANPQSELFVIDQYVPELDPTQFATPLLNGRMSGQYVFEDIPFTGLQLMVGEQTDDTNFIFAIVFTYINGQPVWVVGNTGGEAPGFPQVELEMLRLSGGGFFGQGPGVFTESDVLIEPVGTLFLDPLDCDNVLVGYDFTPINGGIGTLLASRFIDIAGYDCNPWQ